MTMLLLRPRIRGFSLVEMSVVLTIISVVLASILPMLQANLKSGGANDAIDRMDAIEGALTDYLIANGRLPCPASLTANITAATFGTEAATPGTCTGLGGTGNAVFGAVPVKALGLSDEFALDGWNRRIVYHVDRRMTATDADAGTAGNQLPADFYPATGTPSVGVFTVYDATTAPTARTTTAVYVLVSGGANGHGYYNLTGAAMKSSGSTNTREQENCECNASATAGTYDLLFYQQMATGDTSTTNHFDDIVRYRVRSQLDTASTLWSLNGSTNLYPTTLAHRVAIGQSSLTTAPTLTNAELLVWEDANNWTAIQDTTAATSPAFQVYSSIAGGTTATIQNVNTANFSSGLLASTASTGTTTNTFAVRGNAANTSVFGALGVGNLFGVYAASGVAESEAIRGIATGSGNNAWGVRGIADSTITATGTTMGVDGRSESTTAANSIGVRGQLVGSRATSTMAALYGTIGSTSGSAGSLNGFGVYSNIDDGAQMQNAYGLYARVENDVSNNAYGSVGIVSDTTSAQNIVGVIGRASGDAVDNVMGLQATVDSTSSGSNGYALYGSINGTYTSTSRAVSGIVGASTTAGGGNLFGLYGLLQNGASVTGSAYGVYGQIENGVSATGNRYAIYGVNSSTAADAHGVVGQAASTASSYGVFGTGGLGGVYGATTTASGFGVRGVASGATTRAVSAESTGTGVSYGVFGSITSTTATAAAVYGSAGGASGATRGVEGRTSSATGFGVYGFAPAGATGVRCDGTATTTLCSGVTAWSVSSDARLKKDVQTIAEKDGLDAILQLRPVRYHWKDKNSSAEQIGFIAQDVEKVFPNFVMEGGETKFETASGTKEVVQKTKHVTYETIVVPLVKAVQQIDAWLKKLEGWLEELKDSVAKLTARLDAHDKELAALKAENAALKARLDALESKMSVTPAKAGVQR